MTATSILNCLYVSLILLIFALCLLGLSFASADLLVPFAFGCGFVIVATGLTIIAAIYKFESMGLPENEMIP